MVSQRRDYKRREDKREDKNKQGAVQKRYDCLHGLVRSLVISGVWLPMYFCILSGAEFQPNQHLKRGWAWPEQFFRTLFIQCDFVTSYRHVDTRMASFLCRYIC